MINDVKHTPGPWVWLVDKWGFSSLDDQHGNQLLRYTTSDDGVWCVNEADRPLIAAAPDMLEALKAVMAEYREGYGLNCVDQVSAAIAKATGGA